MDKKSFLVVDDYRIVRDGLIAMLEDQFPNANIVGAVSCKEVVELCNTSKFDLVILDLNLSDGRATTILPLIKHSNDRILMMSATIDPNDIIATLKIGATGFISKFASRDEFIFAVESTLKRTRYICSSTIENIVSDERQHHNNILDADPTRALTNKEIQIAKMITTGLTSKEIANDLGISFTTVNKHRNNILKKLEINSSRKLRDFFKHDTKEFHTVNYGQ